MEVSPAGSIPRREHPEWQVTNDKVEASRATLHIGQDAPAGKRPLTRVAAWECNPTKMQRRDRAEPKFTSCEGAAGGGSFRSLRAQVTPPRHFDRMNRPPPHELPPLTQRRESGVTWVFVHSIVNDAQTTPRAPALRTDGRGVGFSALSVVACRSRVGDGLHRVSYCAGSGLSWKPIAAAFRFRAFNMLAFILASYSSIDRVTYSSPYLSIR